MSPIWCRPSLGQKCGTPSFSRNHFPMHSLIWQICLRRCLGRKLGGRCITGPRCRVQQFSSVHWGLCNSQPADAQFLLVKTPRGCAHLGREDRRSIGPRIAEFLLLCLCFGLPSTPNIQIRTFHFHEPSLIPLLLFCLGCRLLQNHLARQDVQFHFQDVQNHWP